MLNEGLVLYLTVAIKVASLNCGDFSFLVSSLLHCFEFEFLAVMSCNNNLIFNSCISFIISPVQFKDIFVNFKRFEEK